VAVEPFQLLMLPWGLLKMCVCYFGVVRQGLNHARATVTGILAVMLSALNNKSSVLCAVADESHRHA
jgi:hypothetical protein